MAKNDKNPVEGNNGLAALEEAIDKAIQDCIRDGILADYLSKDPERVKKMLINEYCVDRYLESLSEDEENDTETDRLSF